ncbi:hypothetical protein JCM33374_g3501 [Metschnikowia sp. JCM 33374]|nr:hypothetical protein JCM33374_g3501 [Metschnikowia sp. JCM 33374]
MSVLHASHSITWSLVWATIVSCISTLQFGFHLAVFNAPQDILSCRKSVSGPFQSYSETLWAHLNLLQCIPMSQASIASINTMFTVGGLVSSTIIGSHYISGTFGRKHLQKISALIFFAGSAMIVMANNVFVLNTGRLLTGLAAGSCMVIAPILISELTPFNHRGLMGSLLQFGVGIGILMAQGFSFPWSNDQQWRNLFVAGAVLGLVQFVLLFTTVESPKWLIMQKGDVSNASEILHGLRTSKSATRREINHWRRLSSSSGVRPVTDSTLLLEDNEDDSYAPLSYTDSGTPIHDDPDAAATLSFADYMLGVKYRKEWVAVAIIMSAQQLCGMNAITFYGVSIMSNIVPQGTNVLYLTLSLALTNVAAALAVCPFIDRWGRRGFLLVSVAFMASFALVISTGLMRKMDYVAAAGCFGFVVAYSIGLGQIPFLMVNELSSTEAVGMGQSLGTMFNWLANICIAFLFPSIMIFGGVTAGEDSNKGGSLSLFGRLGRKGGHSTITPGGSFKFVKVPFHQNCTASRAEMAKSKPSHFQPLGWHTCNYENLNFQEFQIVWRYDFGSSPLDII